MAWRTSNPGVSVNMAMAMAAEAAPKNTTGLAPGAGYHPESLPQRMPASGDVLAAAEHAERLDREIQYLSDTIAELSARLEPVLRDDGPDEVELVFPSSLSPVGASISHNAQHVFYLRARLAALIARVDL